MSVTYCQNKNVLKASIFVDIGLDTETDKAIIVSENEIRDDPESLGGLRQAISPYRGDVDLDGRVVLRLPDRSDFLGRDFYIEHVRHMLGLGRTFCNETPHEMRLNGQTHALRASAAGERIRLEILHRGNPIDSFDFPREEIASEWFLAGARFERVAAELGDVGAKEIATTHFSRLCPKLQDVIGEDRLMSVLNDPIAEVFGVE